MTEEVRREESIDQYGKNLEDIAVFAYEFDGAGNIKPKDPWVLQEAARLMANPQGKTIYITVVNDINEGTGRPPQAFNGQVIHDILSNDARRAEHIRQLVELSAHAHGVETDYERLMAKTRPYFEVFYRELRAALPPDKKISVILQPKFNNTIGDRGNAVDWRAIAPHVDRMVVMAYYYSWGTSPPGPVVNFDQLERLARYTQFDPEQSIPRNKLHILLSLYGWDWPLNARRGSGIIALLTDYDTALATAAVYGVTPRREPDNMNLVYDYKEGEIDHQVWIDDFEGQLAKIERLKALRFPRIDFWHLGVGDRRLWEWIRDNTSTANCPPPLEAATLTELRPAVTTAGGPDLTLTVIGRDFEDGAVVRWNGADRPTTFVSATELRVAILASDIANVGTATITVKTFLDGKNSLTFRMIPRARVASIQPNTAVAGDPAFSLTVRGTNFIEGSQVLWSSAPRTTRFVSATELVADIPASDLVEAGSVPVSAQTTIPAENSVPFLIRARPAVLERLDPSAAVAGDPAFSLRVLGRDFPLDARVLWNGQPRPTRRLSGDELIAEISAADIAVQGQRNITVVAGGSTSNAVRFDILPPRAPVLFNIAPSSAAAGGPAFILSLEGANFSTSTKALWQGLPRTTRVLSSSTLTASILATDIATPGQAQVRVLVGTTTSNAVNFTISSGTVIVPPAAQPPRLTVLEPNRAPVGSPALIVRIRGEGFTPTTRVRWGSREKLARFVTPKLLEIDASRNDLASAGEVRIAALDTAGPSNELVFTIEKAAASAPPSLRDFRVYPNPWVVDKHASRGGITFDRLTPGAEIKIFTVSGRWLRTLTESAGEVLWDLRNSSGEEAASGYYIYVIEDSQHERVRGKIAVVR